MFMFNEYAQKCNEKYLLLLDNLQAHHDELHSVKQWSATSKEKVFVNEKYSNVKMAFFPARCTSHCQPQDQGEYQFIQSRFRQWYNDQLLDQKVPSKCTKVYKIYELMKKIEPRLIRSCWNRSYMTSLHNAEKENDAEFVQIIEKEKEHQVNEEPHRDTDEPSALDQLFADDGELETAFANMEFDEEDDFTDCDSELEEALNDC